MMASHCDLIILVVSRWDPCLIFSNNTHKYWYLFSIQLHSCFSTVKSWMEVVIYFDICVCVTVLCILKINCIHCILIYFFLQNYYMLSVKHIWLFFFKHLLLFFFKHILLFFFKHLLLFFFKHIWLFFFKHLLLFFFKHIWLFFFKHKVILLQTYMVILLQTYMVILLQT